jgi:hypothetical protein
MKPPKKQITVTADFSAAELARQCEAIERARLEGYRQALDDQNRRMVEALEPIIRPILERLGR